MEDLFEGFSGNITLWETIMETAKLDLEDAVPNNGETNDSQIYNFPRQDFVMYGLMPKMEQKIYVKCQYCRFIFSPLDVSGHKTCVGVSTTSKGNSSDRKTKSRGGSNKKNLNNIPRPPVFTKTSSPNKLHNKESSKTSKSVVNHANSKMQDFNTFECDVKGVSPDIPSPSCSNDSLSLDGDSSSPKIMSNSRSGKKSRKAKSTKEFDPDVHCGVMDSNRRPCLRSITCSIHRIQLKKLVPGRSKDIHQLKTEKKMTKERDLLVQSVREIERPETINTIEQIPVVIDVPTPVLIEVPASDIMDVKDNFVDCSEEVEVKEDLKHSEEFIETLHDNKPLEDFRFASIGSMSPVHQENTISFFKNFTQTSLKEEQHFTHVHSLSSLNQESSISSLENFQFSHLSPMSQLKEEYDSKSLEEFKFDRIQPMSPLQQEISESQDIFVSNSMVNVPVTVDKPATFKIPDMDLEDNTASGPHPKPVVFPNYGMKKFGGAVLFNKPQFQLQRNDILRAVNDSRVNFTVFGGSNLTRSKRNHCNLSLIDSDTEFKQMRLDPNLNHFLMQCEIRKPFEDVLLEECQQENFGRNTFTSTIDFE